MCSDSICEAKTMDIVFLSHPNPQPQSHPHPTPHPSPLTLPLTLPLTPRYFQTLQILCATMVLCGLFQVRPTTVEEYYDLRTGSLSPLGNARSTRPTSI